MNNLSETHSSYHHAQDRKFKFLNSHFFFLYYERTDHLVFRFLGQKCTLATHSEDKQVSIRLSWKLIEKRIIHFCSSSAFLVVAVDKLVPWLPLVHMDLNKYYICYYICILGRVAIDIHEIQYMRYFCAC